MQVSKRVSKFIVVASAVLLLLTLFGGVILFLLLQFQLGLQTAQASSIGIIGSADGPTAVFVTSHFPLLPTLGIVLFFLADVVFCVFLVVKFGKGLRAGRKDKVE